LFVEDGALALAIVGIVALSVIVSAVLRDVPIAAGGVLLFGCLLVLFANVARAAQR
jgi:hypothetical protein